MRDGVVLGAGMNTVLSDPDPSAHAEVVAILNEPDTIDRLKKIGGEPKPTTADGFRSRVASDIEKWTKVVADAGIARI